MSKFELSEEREQFKKLAKEFAEGEIEPIAAEFDQNPAFPSDLINKAGEIGLTNFQIPEEFGGLGLSCFDSCVILEELASGCSGISGAIEASSIAILPLINNGSAEQKEAYLKPLAEECGIAGYTSGNDTDCDITYSTKNNTFELNGNHLALINGNHAKWYLITAREANGETLAQFIVPADTAGLTIGERVDTFGRRARTVHEVSLESITLTDENLIEKFDEGHANPKNLAHINCFIASGAVGVAQKALEHAIEYSKQRETFGRPIANHQGVAFMLADMAREIEAARYLTWQAAYLLDEDLDALNESLSAKAFAQDCAMKVSCDAVQVYGGYGYSKEYPVEKLMRDAKLYQLAESSPLQTKSALAKQLVGAC